MTVEERREMGEKRIQRIKARRRRRFWQNMISVAALIVFGYFTVMLFYLF